MTGTDLAFPPPAINQDVNYVSPYRTGTYDAKIAAINPDGTVAIDVWLPGIATSRRVYEEPVLRLRSVSYGPEGLARPRR